MLPAFCSPVRPAQREEEEKPPSDRSLHLKPPHAMTTGPPRFELPSLPAATDGWGPSGPPASLEGGVPYAPFSKGERIGRIADFTPSAYKHGKERAVVALRGRKEQDDEIGVGNRWRKVEDGGLLERIDRCTRSLTSFSLSLCFSVSIHLQAAMTAGTASPLFLSSTWRRTRR